jgi:hypothetical protein
MAKTKIFISFDYEHDIDIKNALVYQSTKQESPFSFNDYSIKEPIDEKWKSVARDKIKGSDIVIFLCGEHTADALGVAAEMSITQELMKPYFLLKGRRKVNVQKPKNAKKSDEIVNWKWKHIDYKINHLLNIK